LRFRNQQIYQYDNHDFGSALRIVIPKLGASREQEGRMAESVSKLAIQTIHPERLPL
jgi:hypothetical protein